MKFATPVAIFVGLTLIAAAIFASSWMNKDVGRFQVTSDKHLILDTKTGCIFDGRRNLPRAYELQPYRHRETCEELKYSHVLKGTFSYLFN